MTVPIIIGFYGYSNTGKTNLIKNIIIYFSKQKINVASIKQTTHSYSIDSPGKDTWEYAKAGAKLTSFQTEVETSFIVKKRLSIKDIIKIILETESIDLILVEGARDTQIQKIRMDMDTPLRKNTIFTFDGDVYKVISFIEEKLKKGSRHYE